jgi:hypothetical protein
MSESPVFLVARTESEGREFILRRGSEIPDLAAAKIVSASWSKWWIGSRPRRVYVAPEAERGATFTRTLRLLTWQMSKTPGADDRPLAIDEDGSVLQIRQTLNTAP